MRRSYSREDAHHQVLRDRRLVAVQGAAIGVGCQPPVLGPLDLGREVAGGPEAERARQRVADLAQQERLGGEDPPRSLAARAPQLGERRRVERARLDALDAEPCEPRAHLARRLVGEGDGEQLVRAERAGRDLPRDPARDRGRLAGARAGEDADRPAHRFGSAPLLGVQAVENRHRATLAAAADGSSSASVPKPCLLAHGSRRRAEARASSSPGARRPRASRPRAPAARARRARPGARPRRRSGR